MDIAAQPLTAPRRQFSSLPGRRICFPLETWKGASLMQLSIGSIASPISDEPVAMGGPFIMNTREEIVEAFADLRAGRLIDAT
jgi:redox-sensitive bicupin YhaK (pirin superfamily)